MKIHPKGIGLILDELENFGLMNETLIIYSSDNGPPFPMGRTNLYDPGIREPLFISNPLRPELWENVRKVLFFKLYYETMDYVFQLLKLNSILDLY